MNDRVTLRVNLESKCSFNRQELLLLVEASAYGTHIQEASEMLHHKMGGSGHIDGHVIRAMSGAKTKRKFSRVDWC